MVSVPTQQQGKNYDCWENAFQEDPKMDQDANAHKNVGTDEDHHIQNPASWRKK
jgi:hypothetical protein